MAKTVIVTDGRYRMAVAAVRTLGMAGYRVLVTQTRAECAGRVKREEDTQTPPAFCSRYAAETVWIEGSVQDSGYADRLIQCCKREEDPVLLCVGGMTQRIVSERREDFARVCHFLLSDPQTLDALNDKDTVQTRAQDLGIPTPKRYTGIPDMFPVVVKPRCGEACGLKAAQRYGIARNVREFSVLYQKMRVYDPDPIVQQKVKGDGIGISLLMGRDGQLLDSFCHRRIREFPVSGGPSSCCESIYDERKTEQIRMLLASFGFCGIAMAEFKGDLLLEINPRIWGSFPLTAVCGSSFLLSYVRASLGEDVVRNGPSYPCGVRMRYCLNDAAAVLGYLRRGHFLRAAGGIADLFRAKEAIWCRDDPRPFWRYLKNRMGG